MEWGDWGLAAKHRELLTHTQCLLPWSRPGNGGSHGDLMEFLAWAIVLRIGLLVRAYSNSYRWGFLQSQIFVIIREIREKIPGSGLLVCGGDLGSLREFSHEEPYLRRKREMRLESTSCPPTRKAVCFPRAARFCCFRIMTWTSLALMFLRMCHAARRSLYCFSLLQSDPPS